MPRKRNSQSPSARSRRAALEIQPAMTPPPANLSVDRESAAFLPRFQPPVPLQGGAQPATQGSTQLQGLDGLWVAVVADLTDLPQAAQDTLVWLGQRPHDTATLVLPPGTLSGQLQQSRRAQWAGQRLGLHVSRSQDLASEQMSLLDDHHRRVSELLVHAATVASRR